MAGTAELLELGHGEPRAYVMNCGQLALPCSGKAGLEGSVRRKKRAQRLAVADQIVAEGLAASALRSANGVCTEPAMVCQRFGTASAPSDQWLIGTSQNQ